MFYFRIRMFLLIALLFAAAYGVLVGLGNYFKIGSPLFYLVLAFIFLFIQYKISPYLVYLTMKVKWISEEEQPELYAIVKDLAQRAKIKMPRIGISYLPLANAFAFGNSPHNFSVCVTPSLLKLLTKEELRAVLGHEISHIKHKDILVITFLSAVPLILYWVFINLIFTRDNRQGRSIIFGIFAYVLYLLSNLLILYASRIREYYADYGSVGLGNSPMALCSALRKLVLNSAHLKTLDLKKVECGRAFFINDPLSSKKDVEGMRDIKLTPFDKIAELFSTHPNVFKRIKLLSTYESKENLS